MAKVRKNFETSKRTGLKIVNFHAAGIDISPKEMQVCVPVESAEENNRTFGVYTKDLQSIASWPVPDHRADSVQVGLSADAA